MVKFYEGIVRNPRRGQMTGVVRDGFPEGAMAPVRSRCKRIPSRDGREFDLFKKLQECQNSCGVVNKEERRGN